MSNTSIINLISQSTTAIAGAAGQTHRFSELVTQSYPAGVTLRFPELAAAHNETIHLWS